MKELPARIAGEFGAGASLARYGVQSLYQALSAAKDGAVRERFEQWRSPFAQAIGRDLDEPAAGMAKLARAYELDASRTRPAELLFSVHTYFAIFLKLVAARALNKRWLSPLADWNDPQQRRSSFESLERGDPFHNAGIVNFLDDDPFGWCARGWSGPIDSLVQEMACRIAGIDLFPGADLAAQLHRELFPKSVRRELGEYYTPPWLAEHVLDALDYDGDVAQRLLDPTCGSGVFLLAAIRRIRAAAGLDLAGKIANAVAGFDLNPLAVLAARTNYLLAIRDLLELDGEGRLIEPITIPVYCCDSILGPSENHSAFASGPGRRFLGAVNVLAGNPPWIAWDYLPPAAREATRPLWERYGLFTLSAKDARHGGGKKDLSALLLYASVDAFLKTGGKLGMVITQTLFQSKGAGDGFRRFQIGEGGPPLRVLRVDDLTRMQPFPGAANWTSTVVLAKGEPTSYPVPYYQWSLATAMPDESSEDWRNCFAIERLCASPIDAKKITSPWMTLPAGLAQQASAVIGRADYSAHLGANAAGASGVFWLRIVRGRGEDVVVANLAETGKQSVAPVECDIERDLLYPLLRWGDVARWRAEPSAVLLLTQDALTRRGIAEEELLRRYPQTYSYLGEFREILEKRAAYRRYQQAGPFYSMYNVGPYTLSPIKVVWRRMDSRINAAVVVEVDDRYLGKRCVIPQETCCLIAAASEGEAHYVCAVLNSSIAGLLVASHSVRQGKGFGTPSILDYLPIRRFDAANDLHNSLAQLSRQAHEAAAGGVGTSRLEEEISQVVARLWGLAPAESSLMQG